MKIKIMKTTEKAQGFCQKCGDQIKGKFSHLLRICLKHSIETAKLTENLSLKLSGNSHKGWS